MDLLNDLIIESNTLNVRKTLMKLHQELSLNVERKNPEQFLKACDDAASNYHEVSLMYFKANKSFQDEKLEFDEKYSKWSDEAMKYLEKEKARGKFSGQTSESKMKHWIINEFTEEYKESKMKYQEKERTITYLQNLMQAWQNRIKLLQSMKGILDKQGVFGNGN